MTKEIDQKYIVKLKGKEYITFEGLKMIAHRDYKLRSMTLEVVELPSKENGNTAIMLSTVTTEDGKTFSDIGDANPENVTDMIKRHIIRMSATRAHGRALRLLTGYGTMIEELDESVAEEAKRSAKQQHQAPNSSGKPSTEGQRKLIVTIIKRSSISLDKLTEMLKDVAGDNAVSMDDLNTKQASTLIKKLEEYEEEKRNK